MFEIADRYTLKADVYSSGTNFGEGEHETVQDPITGEITTRVRSGNTGDRGTVTTIECQVNAIIDGGIRVAGTTETFDIRYNNAEYLRMVYPKKYSDLVTKRSRITNIRTKNDVVIWKNEEAGGEPTGFSVEGPSPIVDPFGKHIENYTLLKREEVQ